MTTRTDYAHEQVFEHVTPDLALEAERFWERCGAIPRADERRRRASELAAIVRDHNGHLAGVGTAYRDILETGDGALEVFMYRTFIDAAQRKPLLFASLFSTACAALEKAAPDGRPSHVAFVTENQKFTRPGVVSKTFQSNALRLVGRDPRGLQIWAYPLHWDGPHRRPFPGAKAPSNVGPHPL